MATLAAEFLEMIQPFRYPRSINESVLREVVAMKGRIEHEVLKADELERNVKLGRGGIREIEFVAQALQAAARRPAAVPARRANAALPGQAGPIRAALGGGIAAACRGLRLSPRGGAPPADGRQPADAHHSRRPARPGTPGAPDGLCDARRSSKPRARPTRSNVRRIFDRLLKADASEGEAPSPFPRQFEGAEPEWKKLLAEHAFKDPDKAFRVLREFVEGPGYVHVSPRTSELAHQLLPRLFALCPQRGRPSGPCEQLARLRRHGSQQPAHGRACRSPIRTGW